MRRVVLIGLTLALAACDTDATDPSKQPIVFTVALSAANEVPAVVAPETNGTGTATITFNVPRDASGNVTGPGTWNVQAVISGLAPTTTITLSHIHTGASGIRGAVFVDTLLTAANAIPVPNGAATINFTELPISQVQAQTVINSPAGHYFNMHSPTNPVGVVRGQLVRQQ
jgi:hypothetical protein